ncbi:hypothetical protein IQ250_20875 [Pseudanabaenaceae cyanobacterium LEGE 13415]|nr:hypothetical protein [Pseudanabaenaceae cyanobacterium LEGE 13415]
MPPIRRQPRSPEPLPPIADPPVGADTIALRATTIEILRALRIHRIIALAGYYDLLQEFNPYALLRLEDTDSNARNFSGNVIGSYSGSYLQQQFSLLTNGAGASVRFNAGAISLLQQMNAPAAYTLICRFRATSTASGSFFGFSNEPAPSWSTGYDRSLYLTEQGQVVLYNWIGSPFFLSAPGDYRDGQPHTLVARMGSGQTTAIFIDGVKVAESTTTGAANYVGHWKIGWSTVFVAGQHRSTFANGITMQGAAIVHAALTDSQITAIHSVA